MDTFTTAAAATATATITVTVTTIPVVVAPENANWGLDGDFVWWCGACCTPGPSGFRLVGLLEGLLGGKEKEEEKKKEEEEEEKNKGRQGRKGKRNA